jgi:hypothetical protein
VDRGTTDREAVNSGSRLEAADRGAGLHGCGDDAVVDEIALDDMSRACQGVLNRAAVASLEAEGQIGGSFRPDLRCIRV